MILQYKELCVIVLHYFIKYISATSMQENMSKAQSRKRNVWLCLTLTIEKKKKLCDQNTKARIYEFANFMQSYRPTQ